MATPGWVLDLIATAVRDVAAAIGPGAETLAADADALVRDGARLAAAVIGAVDAVTDADRLDRLATRGVGLGTVRPTTASRRIQGEAVRLIEACVVCAATIALARLASAGEGAYPDRGAAVAGRDRITALIDAQGGSVGDATYVALRALRAAVVAHIRALTPTLARVDRLGVAAPIPSLVLAYEIYGDATRATEISRRNRARRPGLMRGPVEVLRT